MNSSESGRTMRTRSPLDTPRSSSAFPTRLVSCDSSAYVAAQGSPTIAVLLGCRAAGASTKYAAILNCSGMSVGKSGSGVVEVIFELQLNALLNGRLGSGNTDFVPRRSGRIERIVDFRIPLPARLDARVDCAFVDEDCGVVRADISSLVLDIAIGVGRGLVLYVHDPDRSGAGAILAHRSVLDLQVTNRIRRARWLSGLGCHERTRLG